MVPRQCRGAVFRTIKRGLCLSQRLFSFLLLTLMCRPCIRFPLPRRHGIKPQAWCFTGLLQYVWNRVDITRTFAGYVVLAILTEVVIMGAGILTQGLTSRPGLVPAATIYTPPKYVPLFRSFHCHSLTVDQGWERVRNVLAWGQAYLIDP